MGQEIGVTVTSVEISSRPITLGKTTVRFGWLLEAEDFRLFRGGGKVARNLG